ncbi:MAG: hypothetical protein HOO67_04550 [Candidatus Peribacteraceae bacterium]|nr:hypothetical protein [Candidatus Peribacteraceae bacterium]
MSSGETEPFDREDQAEFMEEFRKIRKPDAAPRSQWTVPLLIGGVVFTVSCCCFCAGSADVQLVPEEGGKADPPKKVAKAPDKMRDQEVKPPIIILPPEENPGNHQAVVPPQKEVAENPKQIALAFEKQGDAFMAEMPPRKRRAYDLYVAALGYIEPEVRKMPRLPDFEELQLIRTRLENKRVRLADPNRMPE